MRFNKMLTAVAAAAAGAMLAGAVPAGVPAHAQAGRQTGTAADSAPLVVTGARLIDGRGAVPADGMTIAIQNGRFRLIRLRIPREAA